MRRVFIIIFLFFVVSNTFAQKAKKPLPPSHIKHVSNRCNKTKNFSKQKRLGNYPFSIAKKVVLVAYNFEYDIMSYKLKVADTILRTYIPICTDTFIYSKMVSTIELNAKQIDSLTDIFYNYDSKSNYKLFTRAGCYYPHNAIVFLDSNNKIKEFIEICFGCSQIERSNYKIELGYFCEGKYNMLLKFFRKVGVNYGTNGETPKIPIPKIKK